MVDMNLKDCKIVIFITAGSMEEAEKISEALVNERLAACCNIIEGVNSVFWWEGKVSRESEVLIMAKSIGALFERIEKRVKEIHSYEVPEIIALPIAAGSEDYLKWIEDETEG